MMMAAQSSGKTGTAKKNTGTVMTSTATTTDTGRSAGPTTQTPQQSTASAPQRPAPSARSGIQLSVDRVTTVALSTGVNSRSIKAIQYALADRGFEPGNKIGRFDQVTRDAYASYQRSIGEHADGVPTAASLDYLGFDII